MFNGQIKVPLVIRTVGGGGRQLGATHSQTPDAIFAHFPGLKVVAPGTPADAKGLLKAAIRDDDPVFFIEHATLYQAKGEVPDDEDFLVPIGVSDVKREGKDVTIVSYSKMLQTSLEAAELAGQGRHRGGGDRPAHAASARHAPDRRVGEEDQPHGGGGRGLARLRRRRGDRRHA